MEALQQAKSNLTYLLLTMSVESGRGWGSEDDKLVEKIVDAIVDAAASEGAKRALRSIAASAQE